MDATGQDPLAFFLAYVHPLWMLTALAATAVVLRFGLLMRRRRLGTERPGTPQKAVLRRSHLLLARPAVVAVMVGFAAGPVSAWWLRGWTPFATFHALLGGVAALLFGACAWWGRRVEAGDGEARNAHGLLGLLALLFAGAASVAGFVLLP